MIDSSYCWKKPAIDEADNGIRDGLAHPVRHDQIDIGDPRQVVGSLFPNRIEVGFAAPVEIAQRHDLAAQCHRSRRSAAQPWPIACSTGELSNWRVVILRLLIQAIENDP